MKHPRAIVFLAAILVALLAPANAQAQTEQTFVVDGSGWGHGVGLSQYGARAMARDGKTVEDIINQYYDGVSLQQISDVLGPGHWMNADPDPLWIGLAQNRTSMKFHMAGGTAGLCKANDGEGACPTQTASPGEQWEFRALGGGQCQFFRDGAPVGNVGTCRGTVEWADPAIVYLDSLGGREYKWGKLRFRPIGDAFHVSLEIDVEHYVRGLAEMPPDWDPVALQAQAIAARTYGIRQALKWGDAGEGGDALDSARKVACWCQLYDSVVDQNYIGYWAEDGVGDAPWVAAIEATEGTVITHPQASQNTVILAYYSSSHGGYSDTNVAGLGASEPAPYLPSRPDPWSVAPEAENPYASWQVVLGASQIAEKYGFDTVTDVQITAQNDPSGSVAEVTITGLRDGVEATEVRTGRSFRSTMGLRSIFFTINGAGAASVRPCTGDVPPAGFTDVDPASVHSPDIDCVADAGVTTGVGDGLFDPSGTVTRWQMALFLTRTAPLLGIDVPAGQATFSDLDGLDQSTIDAIGSLTALGVTKGTSATEFSPDAPVTRWQMALFLTRVHLLTGFELPGGSDQGFTDIGDLGEDAVIAIDQLAELGITSGTSPTTFSPDLPVTREQMASFLARLIRLDGVPG